MTLNGFSKRDAIFIFFCGLALFTLGLRDQEIIGFESRFYLFALEMWRHGLSWFPTTYHEPYPDYPVTSTLLIYLSAKLFGGLNKFTAVFPSAVAAALTLSATYLIGALQERRWGWYSVGFLVFTLAFLTQARTISLDMYVTAVTAWMFYFIYSAKMHEKNIPWIIVGLLLVIGFAIRGPIGLIIPAGVASVFYLLEKDWKTWLYLSVVSASLLLICVCILSGMAYHMGGVHFMQDVFRMEVAGRMEVNRTPSHYFYFVESVGAYAVTYPLAIFVVAGILLQLVKKNVSPHILFLRMLIGWVLIIMLGLSIPADKKIRYILPVAPALALICSYLFIVVQNKFLQWIKKIMYLLCWMIPLLCLGILFLFYQKQIDLNYTVLAIFFLAIQLLMLIYRKSDTWFFLAVLAFFLANVFMVERIDLLANQTRDFVQQIENQRINQHAKLAFYREGRDGLAIKYLANMQQEDNPLFISEIGQAPPAPVFLIVSKENVDTLPDTIRDALPVIASGKIGHDNVIVFGINISAIRLLDAF